MHQVVITGMGVVSPIGSDVETFEARLFEGRHGIEPINHFDTSDIAARVYAPVSGFAVGDHFPPVELRRLDAFCAFGLVAARQALDQSGIVGTVDPYRLGVFMSSGLGGVATALSEFESLQQRGAKRVSPMLIPKWIPNMLSGLVAIEAGASGPVMAHGAACASSAVSVGEGLRTIRHGYADAVICGGAEAVTQKLVMAGFASLRALSPSADPDRASIPFDRERSGFVMGEGGAVVVLERLEHAQARGAQILAEVSGYGVTNDAFHITAPAEDGAAIGRSITEALAEAGECPGAVHVNAHGTGTAKNDALEAEAVWRAFGERALVTSTKSVTGHLLGAAGVAEAIAATLALRRQAVPPTAGTRTLDDGVRIDVVRERQRPAQFDRAVSLSLGFGGHNVCLVLDRVGR